MTLGYLSVWYFWMCCFSWIQIAKLTDEFNFFLTLTFFWEEFYARNLFFRLSHFLRVGSIQFSFSIFVRCLKRSHVHVIVKWGRCYHLEILCNVSISAFFYSVFFLSSNKTKREKTSSKRADNSFSMFRKYGTSSRISSTEREFVYILALPAG